MMARHQKVSSSSMNSNKHPATKFMPCMILQGDPKQKNRPMEICENRHSPKEHSMSVTGAVAMGTCNKYPWPGEKLVVKFQAHLNARTKGVQQPGQGNVPDSTQQRGYAWHRLQVCGAKQSDRCHP